jgi:hypothetical protein
MTEMSFGDLSSLLVKTGRVVDPDPVELDQLNLTEHLASAANAPPSSNFSRGSEEDIMEELENLMLKLDSVFQAFHDPKLGGGVGVQGKKHRQLGGVVGEVGDLIGSFAVQYIQHHEL